jgi:cytochrome c-type biogenesis protein CcmE
MAMKRKHKRLTFVIVAMALVGVATGLVLYALGDGVSLFHSPTDIVTKKPGPNQSVRLGGLVEEGSVQRAQGSATVRFKVTDLENAVEVVYEGLLPDLFREGQGIVTTGKVVNGTFVAEEVLAKHDENYMPPEAVDALKKSGQWQGDEEQTDAAGATQ